MPVHEHYNTIKIDMPLAPAVRTDDVNTSGVDLAGFNSACLTVLVGASGDTLSGSLKWTITLQESADNSTFTDVAAADCVNGEASVVIDDAAEDETEVVFAYKGSKRYIRAAIVKTGTHTNGTPIGAVVTLGHAALAPVTQAN